LQSAYHCFKWFSFIQILVALKRAFGLLLWRIFHACGSQGTAPSALEKFTSVELFK